MRKTLLSLLTASSLLASAASSQEPLELYPDLRGDEVTAIILGGSSEYPTVTIQFNTDKKDVFADTKYIYGVKRMGKNLIVLTNPFAVGIDRNRNQKDDRGEITYLNGKISEKLSRSPPVNAQELYPVLKGDDLILIEFGPFPEKEGLFAFIQYALTGKREESIVYSHKILDAINGNSFILASPSNVFFNTNRNRVFEFNSKEMFSLEKERLEKSEPKEPKKSIKYDSKKGLEV